MKPKKQTKADFCRQWGVPSPTHLRYSGLKGVYWYWLSRQIRKEEWQKYGVCLTCQEKIPKWEEADCGHILAASKCGFGLLFARRNLTIQHKKCNNPLFTPDAGVRNGINLDKRYGAGFSEKLLSERGKITKEWDKATYEQKIQELPSFQAWKVTCG